MYDTYMIQVFKHVHARTHTLSCDLAVLTCVDVEGYVFGTQFFPHCQEGSA